MDSDISRQLRTWLYRDAPAEFQALFPKGKAEDWMVHVAAPELRPVADHTLLRWRAVFPVEVALLPDGGALYWGAETQGLAVMVESHRKAESAAAGRQERRKAPRIPIRCSLRYEIQGEPKRSGSGESIDVSETGISFTTETRLPANTELILYLAWPIPLERDIPLELRAAGTLVRTEAAKAVLLVGTATFSIAG